MTGRIELRNYARLVQELEDEDLDIANTDVDELRDRIRRWKV